MSYSLPKYYFRDIPAYLMDEIIAGMIEGKTEPTPEEMEEWLASDHYPNQAALFACFFHLAQRARCAAAIFRRAAIESVRFGLRVLTPVRFRPFKLPII
jgi:hypothetical protein